MCRIDYNLFKGMQKVITFGEIMLRLATPGYKKFIWSRNQSYYKRRGKSWNIFSGNRCSCTSLQSYGDYNLVTLSEVETFMKGDGSGRVVR